MSQESRSLYRIFLLLLDLLGGSILLANAYSQELQKSVASLTLSLTMEFCGVSLIISVIALLLNRLRLVYFARWAFIGGAFLSIFAAIAYARPEDMIDVLVAAYLPFGLMLFQLTITMSTRQFLREEARAA